MDFFLDLSSHLKKIFLASSEGTPLFLEECTHSTILNVFIKKIEKLPPPQVFVYIPKNETTAIRSELAFIQGFLLAKNIPLNVYKNINIFLSMCPQFNKNIQILFIFPGKISKEYDIFYSIHQKEFENKILSEENIVSFLQNIKTKQTDFFIFIHENLSLPKIENICSQIEKFSHHSTEVIKKIQLHYKLK